MVNLTVPRRNVEFFQIIQNLNSIKHNTNKTQQTKLPLNF